MVDDGSDALGSGINLWLTNWVHALKIIFWE